MSKIFSVINEGQYSQIKICGIKFCHIVSDSNVGIKEQIFHSIIKNLKTLIGLKSFKFCQNKNYDITIYGFDLFYYKHLFSKNLKESYLKLIKGMDEKSIEIVSLIINRINKCLERSYYKIFKFEALDFEKKEIKRIENKFFSQIFNAGDNCIYGHYVFSQRGIPPNVFYYKEYLEKIKADGGGGGVKQKKKNFFSFFSQKKTAQRHI
jgi:hypothetical protein